MAKYEEKAYQEKRAEVRAEKEKRIIMRRPPQVFESGIVLLDNFKQAWKIIEPIDHGSFGAVYSAERVGSIVVDPAEDVRFAIKIEPYESPPLCSEVNFFAKFLRADVINSWKAEHGLSFLGVPEYFGSGSCMQKGFRHRFLVMNKLGPNIVEKLYDESDKLDEGLLKTFLCQIVDSLHYIHDHDHYHGDIKSENLLLKRDLTSNEVYLVDYGLSYPCTKDDTVKSNRKRKHNGTPLYCSRDAHLGVCTKRSDMETLGFNLLVWHGFPVPWGSISAASAVHQSKISFMSSIADLRDSTLPKYVVDYLEYVNMLKHLETPDYEHVKQMFRSADEGPKRSINETEDEILEPIDLSVGNKKSKKSEL